MASALTVTPEVESLLTDREKKALDSFSASASPAMSPATAANFFALFVEGYSLEQMLESNRAWGLGALVDARVRYSWDARKAKYVDDIHIQAVERVRKLQAEAVNFLSDLAAVAHVEFRQEMLAYLKNPIEENLPKGRLKSIKDYKDLLETLEKVQKLGMPQAPPAPPEQPQAVSINVEAGGKVAVAIGSGSGLLGRLAGESRGDKS